MWICMCGHTPDVVIYSKFHRNPLRGFGAPGGRYLPIPITLAIGFYNSLHYRASRDICRSLSAPPSSRQHLSNNDCPKDKTEDYQNCAVYDSVHSNTNTFVKVNCWFRFRFPLDWSLFFCFFAILFLCLLC